MPTRSIPWPRILAEGVAIVVSILLAFGIQAWWEARQERAEEQQVLLGLKADYTQIEVDLTEGEMWSQMFADDITWLLSLEDTEPEEIPVAQVDLSLARMVRTPTYEPGEATFDGLVNSGRLELLRNAELRERLNRWRRTLDEVQDGELVMRNFEQETLVPYLAREGVALERFRRLYELGAALASRDSLPDIDDPVAAAAYARLLDQVEFRSLAEYRRRWMAGTAGEYGRALAEVREILRLIERSLRP